MQSLWMLIAALLFSIMAACVKAASPFHHSIEIAFIRGLIGFVIMSFIGLKSTVSLKTTNIGLHIKRSITGVSALMLWFYAIGKIPLAVAMTMNYMSPIWLAIFAIAIPSFISRVFPQQKQPLHRIGIREQILVTICILISFIGVLLVIEPQKFIHRSIQFESIVPIICGLSSGILAALAYRNIQSLGAAGEPEIRIVFYFSVISTLVTGSALPFLETTFTNPSGWEYMVLAGIAATFAQLALTRAYGYGKTLLSANLSYTGIIFSAIWGIIFWNEPLDFYGFLGISMIIISSVLSTYVTAQFAQLASTDYAH